MSYFAGGSGTILLNRNLTEKEKDRIGEIFDETFDEVYAEDDTIDLIKYDDKYDDDMTIDTLKSFLNEFRDSVHSGSIEFVGEDNANWRFAIDRTEDDNPIWVIQDGYIEWGDPSIL